MKNRLELIVTIFVIIGMVVGGLAYLERYAKASDVQFLSMRLEQHVVGDRIATIDQWLDRLEAKHGSTNCLIWNNQMDRDRYKKLQRDKKKLEKEFDNLRKK